MKRIIVMVLAIMLVLMTACGEKKPASTEESVAVIDSGEENSEITEESAAEPEAEVSEESAEESAEEETAAEESLNGALEIGTAEELAAFRDLVNNGTKDVNAVLTADIDMSGVCSESIGSWQGISGYIGTFDGQGHVISNLYAVNDEGDDMGLFKYCEENSIICNLGVEDSYVESWNNAGAIVAKSKGTVENCWSNATVIGGTAGGVAGDIKTAINCYNLGTVQGKNRIGGVVGWGRDISGCYNEGPVEGLGENEDTTGGVVGFVLYGSVEDCYNKGTVTGNHAGGICGEADENTLINRCCNYGDINSVLGGGGIAGKTQKMSVKNCANQGNIIGSGSDGGIVGSSRSVSIYNCYNWGDITSENEWSHTYPAGISGHAEGINIANCYSIGNVTGTFPGGVFSVAVNQEIEENVFYKEETAPAYSSKCDDPSQNAVTEAQVTDGTLTSALQSYAEGSDQELSGWKDGEKGPVLDWEE